MITMGKYLVLQPGMTIKELNSEEYESTYELIRDNVDGFIECVPWVKPFADRGIHLWINDESKLLDLALCLAIRNNGQIIEILSGNIVFARFNRQGETLPLEDEDIKFIKESLNCNSAVIGFNNPFTGNSLFGLIPVVGY